MAAAFCLTGVERQKKDDDSSSVGYAPRSDTASPYLGMLQRCAFLVLLAVALLGVFFVGMTSLELIFAGGRSSIVWSLGDASVPIAASRATALLDREKWQYGNVSASEFPDGSPVKFFESRNANVWEMARTQTWEKETFIVFKTLLSQPASRRPGAWMLDIGGWIGLTGLYAAQFVPNVLAFEPDNVARSELVANVWLNPAFEPKIRVTPKCVSHERKTVQMKGDPGGSWSSILFGDKDKGTLVSWEVECLPFVGASIRRASLRRPLLARAFFFHFHTSVRAILRSRCASRARPR